MLSAEIMHKHLITVSKWANQRKPSFNPDITKQTQEVIFSRESKKTDHHTVYFNDALAVHTIFQKYLGMYLDEKLYQKVIESNRRQIVYFEDTLLLLYISHLLDLILITVI